jgi:hypothetical protein
MHRSIKFIEETKIKGKHDVIKITFGQDGGGKILMMSTIG